MHHSKTRSIIGISITIIVVLVVSIHLIRSSHRTTPPDAQNQVLTDEMLVKSQVTEFGMNMQKVSVLAPADALETSMKDAYGAYATSSAIDEWVQNPSAAPGREVSSPWPDHIDIVSVNIEGDSATVTGNVIELTSDEVEHGGVANSYPVTLELQKQAGIWRIASFSRMTVQ
jgi:hypothetical protein